MLERCKLYPQKEPRNAANNYGGRQWHNFFGRFCFCDQLYDAETEMRDMVKCLVCEDWYHESCLGEAQRPVSFDNLVCSACVAESPVLKRLPPSTVVSAGLGVCVSSVQAVGGGARYLNGELKDAICRCAACQTMLSAEPALGFIQNEPIEWQPEPDTDPEPSLESAVRILEKTQGKVKVDEGLYMMNSFAKHFASCIRQLQSEKDVVTKEVYLSDEKVYLDLVGH